MFTSYQKRPRLQTFWNFSASSIIHIINKRRQKNTHLHCSLLFESFLVYIILPWEMKSVIFKRFSQANPSLYSFVTCNDIQIFLKKLFNIYLGFCKKWMKIIKSSRSITIDIFTVYEYNQYFRLKIEKPRCGSKLIILNPYFMFSILCEIWHFIFPLVAKSSRSRHHKST